MLSTSKLIKTQSADLKELKDEEIKEIQFILLEFMDFLSEYFKKHDINYYLGGGSALGAIRHDGFIPWDDDLDINIPRDSFEKLRTLAEEKDPELLSYVDVCDSRLDDDFDVNFMKLKIKNTVYIEYLYQNYDKKGIFIDIFPVDNTYDNFFLRCFHGFITTVLLFICSCLRVLKKKDLYINAVDSESYKRSVRIKCFIGKIFSFKKLNWWLNKTDKLMSICTNNNSKYITVPTGKNHYFGELIDRKMIEPYKLTKFENRYFSVAFRNDEYMKKLFGDYMRVPLESEREKHYILEYSSNKKEIKIPKSINNLNE